MWLALFILVLLIPLTAVVLDSHLGRALASRLERRPGRNEEALLERVATLESEVERIGHELRRLEEESEFLRRLLTERHGPEQAPERRLPSA